MASLFIFTVVFVLANAGVGAFRKWSMGKGLLDSPNERSSHITPTPRGGGIVIAILCLAFYAGISFLYPATFSWGYLFGAVIVALVSWFDDVYSLWFLWRLAAHAVAAFLLIFSTGFEALGLFSALVSLLWIVWLINSYNFMDGIDGIAGLQALIVAASWLALGYFFEMPVIFYFCGVIAASSCGFLVHNWPPATVFMGDVGSAFLGFTFAAMPLLATKQTSRSLHLFAFSGLIFLWFFIFDSIVTFAYRLAHGRNVFKAHREHIYQRLVQSGMSHGKVTTIYGILTVIVCVSTILGVSLSREVYPLMLIAPAVLTGVLILIYFISGQKTTADD